MLVNDEVLVMCEPNPWVDETDKGPGHPFFSYRQAIHPREMLGKSVLAPVLDLQTYINNNGTNQQHIAQLKKDVIDKANLGMKTDAINNKNANNAAAASSFKPIDMTAIARNPASTRAATGATGTRC